ncbi:MAG: ABC-F family ATP-binding cassette domain-containing protein [Oscillospiraceae bacterium]|nr:ABC-F family ATP-binding cassette domain-containing protein [Oscillospiraceae bacterium]
MVLTLQNISFSYGDNTVIEDASFQLEEYDRAGLVGYNGCGKTTLLGIITGSLIPDGGTVALKNGAVMGYLRQDSGLHDEQTVLGEMKMANNADKLLEQMRSLERRMEREPELLSEYMAVSEKYEAIDGYHLDYQIRRILLGMGFPEETWTKSVSVLSGGEKTRLSLAKLLLQTPDLLLLDEPTNHLDLETLDWLEGYLTGYRGAVLVVSHDRHFLDSVCNKTIQLNRGRTKTYPVPFSEYIVRRDNDEKVERAHYEQTLEKAEKYREFAERNMARASTRNMAKSRLKMLERLDLTAPEDNSHTDIKFEIIPDGEPYKDVLELTDLSVGVPGLVLCSGIDLLLQRGERIAVIGRNGYGKTTLIRTILGEIRPIAGRVIIGGGVKIGVQKQDLFHIENESPLMYIWDRYPQMDQLQVRKLLALVGFRDEEVFTESSGLSGGELARLNMARLSLEHPNFLILDEPTNHLDIFTKDILFEALNTYSGTLFMVSHDRWLIENLNCRILFMDEGTAKLFDDYDSFRSYTQASRNGQPEQPEQKKEKPVQGYLGGREARKQKAEYRQRRSQLEKRIEELEQEEKDTEAAIADPAVASDAEKLNELCIRLDGIKKELAEVTDEYLAEFSD